MRAAGGELTPAPAREPTGDPDSDADGRPDMTDQTGSWLDVLNLVGLQSVLDGRSLAPDNNLLLPAQPGSAPTDGTLVQPDARPAISGPARVGVVLGPEGTLRGVARVLQQVVGTGRISETDAAGAVLAYAATFLNLPGTTAIMVGLRVPIPVEISSSGWVVSVAGTQALAAACRPEWLDALDVPAAALDVPSSDQVDQAGTDLATRFPDVTARAQQLVSLLLRNPFDASLLALAALPASTPAILAASGPLALRCCDALGNSLGAGASLAPERTGFLAATTGGNAVLRRLWFVLDGLDPDTLTNTDSDSRTQGLAVLASALGLSGGLDPRAARPSVTPAEPPLAPGQGVDRGGRRPAPGNNATSEPVGGWHRLVLGRDLCAGFRETYPGASQYVGPAYVGRTNLNALVTARAHVLNPSGGIGQADRLEIAWKNADNEGSSDGIRLCDFGLVSVGLQQWTSRYELPALLGAWNTEAPDEFDVYLGLYGIAIRQDPKGNWILQHLGPNPGDGLKDLTAATGTDNQLTTFGGVKTSTKVDFTGGGIDWAARFRAPGLFSSSLQNRQLLVAAARFDAVRTYKRKVMTWELAGRTGLHVEDIFTSKLGAALVFDQHINSAGNILPDITAAIKDVQDEHSPTALTADVIRMVVAAYREKRTFNNDPGQTVFKQRDDGIEKGKFSDVPGSFHGWTL